VLRLAYLVAEPPLNGWRARERVMPGYELPRRDWQVRDPVEALNTSRVGFLQLHEAELRWNS
jgi:hypothetical protein